MYRPSSPTLKPVVCLGGATASEESTRSSKLMSGRTSAPNSDIVRSMACRSSLVSSIRALARSQPSISFGSFGIPPTSLSRNSSRALYALKSVAPAANTPLLDACARLTSAIALPFTCSITACSYCSGSCPAAGPDRSHTTLTHGRHELCSSWRGAQTRARTAYLLTMCYRRQYLIIDRQH
jgi:hypothetical protein